MSAEVKWDFVIATAGVSRRSDGRLYTEDCLRNAGDGRNGGDIRYDEASKSLIQVGPYTEGDWGRAVYTFPPSKETK